LRPGCATRHGLARIVGGADTVSATIRLVAAASEQHLVAADQIGTKIEQINGATRQAADGAGQAASAATQLSPKREQARELVFDPVKRLERGLGVVDRAGRRAGSRGSLSSPAEAAAVAGMSRVSSALVALCG
jgi:hypothetical protein